VAYDGPVAREMLGEAGVLVPRGDRAALAAVCRTLLEDAPQRKWRGQALRERAVAEFGWPALARRLADVYRTCTG
jgi:starch synthase